MDFQLIGIGAALTSALAWAGGAILYKKIGESASSFGMNVVKSILSLLLLGSVLALVGIEHIHSEALVLLVISGLLGIAVGDTLFFEALLRVSPHIVVLLSLLGQVLTIVFAVIFLGETLTLTMMAGIGLVLAGIAVVLYKKVSLEECNVSLIGIIFGLLSVVSMSVSIIIAKKGLVSVSALQATFIRIAAGTAGLIVWGLLSGRLGEWLKPFGDTVLMKKISTAVIVASMGGFWLFHVALKYIDVSIASTLSATETLFVIPLAMIFLKETITPRSMVGTVISVCGVILLIPF